MICWMCNHSLANSREHIFKKSDLTRVFGKGPFKGHNAVSHFKNGNENHIQGADSKKLKYKSSLCEACNTTVTQPFDRAYDKFINYVYKNEALILKKRFIDFFEVYGESFEEEQRNLYKYYAKSFGCRLIDAGSDVPSDVCDLFFKDSFNTNLRINFSVSECLLSMPNKDRDGFCGKGDLDVLKDKKNSKKTNGYQWSEHVSWLYAHHWYRTTPDGKLGSIWIADNQFIYLGSIESDEKSLEYFERKIKNILD
ncbi:MAG: hypothetical protein KAT04_04440 [Methylococcales bacterium]|nr:hypothetical protein [Methylococcales bacterium]